VSFEVRVADSQSGGETRVAMRSRSGATIHVSDQVSLTNADIASARVVRSDSRYGVEVTFTEAGAARMRAVTSANIGRLLAVLVDGEVVTAPRVTSAVSEIGILTGDYTRAEAERVAAGLLRRAPR
jgi:preprotein translocase subunit SecD